MNGMNLEGITPTAALAATLNQRAQTLRQDLEQARNSRKGRSLATSLKKTALDPAPYFRMIAHPQQA